MQQVLFHYIQKRNQVRHLRNIVAEKHGQATTAKSNQYIT